MIDTATPALTLGLWDDGVMVARIHEVIGRGHAERLVPALAELPDGGRADRIVVGVGPGSFTGIRVGVAAARALALAWDVPVDGLPTLALMAGQASGGPVSGGPVWVAIPGGHDEAFVQGFAGKPVRPDGDPLAVPLAKLGAHTADRTLLAPHRLRSTLSPFIELEVDAAAFGRVAHLATLAPTPLYVRAPDARPAGAKAL